MYNNLPAVIVHSKPRPVTEPSVLNCTNICLPVDCEFTSCNDPEKVSISLDLLFKPSYTRR